MCVFSNIFFETTGPIEAKFYSSLMSTSGGKRGGGGGALSRDFTINLYPQCRAFSRALKTEKLKAPLFPGPIGAGTTNDWCINFVGVVVEIHTSSRRLVCLFSRFK